MGTRSRPGAFNCYAAALPDEEVFSVLARDPAFPGTIRFWIGERARLGKNVTEDDLKRLAEAAQVAENGRSWREENLHGPNDRPTWKEPRLAAVLDDEDRPVRIETKAASDTVDLAQAPPLPPHRFSYFFKGEQYAYARGLEINPSHLPLALDAMTKDGWHLLAIFGATESAHIGFIFKRETYSAFELAHGFGGGFEREKLPAWPDKTDPRWETMSETVDHPAHYNSHPGGIECIEVAEHLGFNLGNALKYLWRCGDKHPDPTEDLRKALWYMRRRLDQEFPPQPDPELRAYLDEFRPRMFDKHSWPAPVAEALSCLIEAHTGKIGVFGKALQRAHDCVTNLLGIDRTVLIPGLTDTDETAGQFGRQPVPGEHENMRGEPTRDGKFPGDTGYDLPLDGC